jgi:hypothetical protein
MVVLIFLRYLLVVWAAALVLLLVKLLQQLQLPLELLLVVVRLLEMA